MDSTPLPDPKSILVVDDELSVLNVIKCMLESANYSVLSANSAESALRLAERRELTIDLALIDVVMPDGSGPDLAESILALRPDLKVLFMSGYANAEIVRANVLDRAIGFLPKPFTPHGLLERVRNILTASD